MSSVAVNLTWETDKEEGSSQGAVFSKFVIVALIAWKRWSPLFHSRCSCILQVWMILTLAFSLSYWLDDTGFDSWQDQEIKNEWGCTSAPSTCLDGVRRDGFTSVCHGNHCRILQLHLCYLLSSDDTSWSLQIHSSFNFSFIYHLYLCNMSAWNCFFLN
jgi:hypothetical protein